MNFYNLSAVGEVEFAEATATGIKFRARIKKIAELGLVSTLSIWLTLL